jgi:hypothetical protein
MNETPAKRALLRRLTLAEGVGLAAVLIAALGYWDAHHARITAAREREAEIKADALKHSFLIIGAVEGEGDKLRLSSAHPEQVIQTQTLWFPSDVRTDSIETTGNPRLEANWIENGLDRTSGKTKHGRLPVGLTTVFIEDGQTKTDHGLYVVAYSLHPRLLRSPKLELEGLSLMRGGIPADPKATLNSLWLRR